jgi:hypothetical protein
MRLILTVLLALMCRAVLAQMHVPLFNEPTRMWTTEFSGTLDAQCMDTYLTTYWLAGETVIDGLTYTLVANRTAYWQSPILSMNCTMSYEYEGPIHLVREVDRRVFFRSGDSEHLIYDLTAEVGDTIPFPSNSTPTMMAPNDTWITVAAIDSIEVDGQYRKRFIADSLDQLDPQPMVIEGIGGGNGPFQPLYGHLGLSHGVRLLCVMEHGEVIFGSPGCPLITGTPEAGPHEVITVFPNPTNGVVRFGDIPVRYTFTDVTGRSVLRGEGTAADLSAQPPGVLLLRLCSLKGVYLGSIRVVRSGN